MNTLPGETTQIVRRINDPEVPPCPLLARNLLMRGTPKAIEGVISSLDGCAEHDEWYAVIDLLVKATAVPDSRFEAILDSRRASRDLRHAAAHILSRRGVARGHEVLLDQFVTRAVVERFVRRGFVGIRTMCRAIEPEADWANKSRKGFAGAKEGGAGDGRHGSLVICEKCSARTASAYKLVVPVKWTPKFGPGIRVVRGACSKLYPFTRS